ncbi:MAG: BLUF domain-containing protein [Bacteroidota bacterium]
MYSLVYKSIAKPDFDLPKIREMVGKARKYNQSQEITGCLLFHEGQFIQYLEGNQIKVLQLYDSIKKDSRHHTIELLAYGDIEKREFQRWTMAFKDLKGGADNMVYLRLLVEDYVQNEKKLYLPHSPKTAFWGEIGKLMD